jgi:hypothetical protein
LIQYLSCICRSLRALNSPYYPGAILEGESRSLLWPMATTLSVLYFRRMKTPVMRLKCLGRLVMPNFLCCIVLYCIVLYCIVWTRKSLIGSVVSCRVGFQQNLGQKLVTDPSCQHNFCGHQQHQGHNKQESTTFIPPYGSNKQHCMDKEELHWVFGVIL